MAFGGQKMVWYGSRKKIENKFYVWLSQDTLVDKDIEGYSWHSKTSSNSSIGILFENKQRKLWNLVVIVSPLNQVLCYQEHSVTNYMQTSLISYYTSPFVIWEEMERV